MIRFSSDPLASILERLAKVEAELALLKERNVTHNVTSNVTRNGNAERQRRYRERKKARVG